MGVVSMVPGSIKIVSGGSGSNGALVSTGAGSIGAPVSSGWGGTASGAGPPLAATPAEAGSTLLLAAAIGYIHQFDWSFRRCTAASTPMRG